METPRAEQPPESETLTALNALASWASSVSRPNEGARNATLAEIREGLANVPWSAVEWALYVCLNNGLIRELNVMRHHVTRRNWYTQSTRKEPHEYPGYEFLPTFFKAWRSDGFRALLSTPLVDISSDNSDRKQIKRYLIANAFRHFDYRRWLPLFCTMAVIAFLFRGCSKDSQTPPRPKLDITPVSDESTKSNAVVDVIFVHGLSGDQFSTWKNDRGDFWPQWLAEDLKGEAAVWTLGYQAAMTNWDGVSMPLSDRATSVLNLLVNSSRTQFGKRPVIFIAHSLGGLVVKKCLQTGLTNSGSKSMKDIAEQTVGVVYFSTPHTGSDKANWLRFVAEKTGISVSDATTDLQKNNATLRELHQWYTNNCRSRLQSLVFFENEPLGPLGLIVDEGSANDGLCPAPIRRDANHISVCKFPSRGVYQDSGVLSFIKKRIKHIHAIQQEVNTKTRQLHDIRRQPLTAESIDSYSTLQAITDFLNENDDAKAETKRERLLFANNIRRVTSAMIEGNDKIAAAGRHLNAEPPDFESALRQTQEAIEIYGEPLATLDLGAMHTSMLRNLLFGAYIQVGTIHVYTRRCSQLRHVEDRIEEVARGFELRLEGTLATVEDGIAAYRSLGQSSAREECKDGANRIVKVLESAKTRISNLRLAIDEVPIHD